MKTPALPTLYVVLAVGLAVSCSREAEDNAPTATAATQSDEGALRAQTGALIQGDSPRSTNAAVALDARPLAGQAEIGVRSLLGNPTSCEDVAKGRTCRYAHAATDVTYIDGMADWIAVDDLGDAPFSAAALARVGLPTDEAPIESTAQMIRWQNLAGYREVTLYPAPDGRAGRIEMKMATL